MNILKLMQILPVYIFLAVMLVAMISIMIIVYLKFIHKPKTEAENEAKYSTFRREDISTYVPIKDIRDSMVIMEDGVTYLAAVICRGFDFFYAHPKEQYETNAGYLGFVNSLEKQVQMHINTKQFDLEPQIKLYLKEQLDLEKKLLEMYDDAVFLEKNYEKVDSETQKAYAEKLTQYNKDINNMEWEISHVEQIIAYLKEMTGEKSTPVREISYIISWEYDPADFPANTTKHDVIKRAGKELENKIEQMKHSLSMANVRVHRADDNELIDIMRNHFRPFGKNIYKASDIQKSNLDELVVTSSSLEDARKNYEAYQKAVDEYLRKIDFLQKREGMGA